MLDPIKILQIDLSKELESYKFDSKYRSARILFRWKEKPLFHAILPFINGELRRETIVDYLFEHQSHQLFVNYLDSEILKIESKNAPSLPFVSVAVCTRDRTENLEKCLRSIEQSDYDNFEVLVIDNAPSDESTKQFVETNFPKFRYILEEKPGLDWARNKAIVEAKGDIIAYTDDDVKVDKYWVSSIAKSFAADPNIMVITGLVAPLELESESQILFEKYNGFGRGYTPQYINVKSNKAKRWLNFGTGQYGTGANMAFRKHVFQKIGMLDPALYVCTVTNGGGDLDMLFRILKFELSLVYQPKAVVFHKHRIDYNSLREQIRNNGIGLYSFFTKNFLMFPDERWQIFKLAVYWFIQWNIIRSISAIFKPGFLPKELIYAELKGSLLGITKYFKARKRALKLGTEIKKFKPRTLDNQPDIKDNVGVHIVDLNNPISDIKNFSEYLFVKIIAKYKNQLLGEVIISNPDKIITSERIKNELLNSSLFLSNNITLLVKHQSEKDVIKNFYLSLKIDLQTSTVTLNDQETVSVLICTLDRPDDLRESLNSILKQKTDRNFEIVVVDNNPESGLTRKVLRDFPQVKLVNEHRRGLAAARNAGIKNSSGDIILITDDDIIAPDDWMERILSNFADSTISGVSGGIIPQNLDGAPQLIFESYGALSKGYRKTLFTPEWFNHYRFKTVPTWDIGATANFAIRKNIFKKYNVEYLTNNLGPGTPAGVGEDTFLFYQMLKNNLNIVYDPSAFILHKHRASYKSLIKQIYNYSKGHVGYNLEIVLREGDFRGLVRIFVELPIGYAYRVIYKLSGKTNYPLFFLLIEMLGNLLGSFTYFYSIFKAKYLDRKYSCLQPIKEKKTVVSKFTF